VKTSDLVATARDGQEVHGWVLEPPGAGPHPTLLVIHGGPFAQYTGADLALRQALSPQAVVGRVRTPTLVMHSEDDLRCPLSQAQRYHLGLVRAGVETEMLVFPREHSCSAEIPVGISSAM
jgi:dipeptidyl aminopeptidase/acylaminoacyl peptidase